MCSLRMLLYFFNVHGLDFVFDIRSFSEERLNEDKLVVGETVSSRLAGL